MDAGSRRSRTSLQRALRRSGSRRANRGRGPAPSGPGSDREKQVYSFMANEPAWVSTKDGDYVKGKVLSQAGLLLTVRIDGKKSPEQVDLRTRSVYPRNPDNASTAPDMTALHHINDPCILENLEKRSYMDEAYTFMGNVLVSVNPLKEIKPPPGALGTRDAAKVPHPFAIAEYAFQQMSFAGDKRRRREDDLIVNQSIVASGESGAGKTEASKRVLSHLVQRTARAPNANSSKLRTIDTRLLQSNEITESFGNAKTLRNDNSSRFGKFMKLHFSQIDTPRGEPAAFKISAASVETYLLERSRVSLHDKGERNYHVFYELLAGASSARLKEYHLDRVKKTGFRYLAPLKTATQVDVPAKATKEEIIKEDKAHFSVLEKAMVEMGFDDQEMDAIFRVVAGVMHLGNLGFTDEERPEGDVARPVETESGYNALDSAAMMLGVPAEQLKGLLLERIIHTREGSITVHRNAHASSFTRDAVAKGLYSELFNFVVNRINKSLDETRSDEDVSGLPFIGVLDIFGFESFAHNGFEQLLINFTNESLQSTFNRKVFEAELTLYEREGLVVDHAQMRQPPDNEAAMTLLAGALKYPGTGDQLREEKNAILVNLDLQCRELQPSDSKMLKSFHKAFKHHPNFPAPHPRNMHEQFQVKHYAGVVVYTVGSFIEKNNDSLPREVNHLFSQSTSPVLGPTFEHLYRTEGGGPRGKATITRSVVKQFRQQIIDLLNTLDSTACSFIRCVKPNTSMSRGKTKDWFSRTYVAHQLKHLSIPQTAVVLKSGLPTRINYETLKDTYTRIIPASATKRFKGKQNAAKMFVQALFWAFEIPPASFKMGHTKVFFSAGEIAALDRILQRAEVWEGTTDKATKKERDRVVARFAQYYSRIMWRRAFAKVFSQSVFKRMLVKRREGAIKIQSFMRMAVVRKKFLAQLRSMRATEAERKRMEKEQKAEEERKLAQEQERERIEREQAEELERIAQEEREALEKEQSLRQQTMSVSAQDDVHTLSDSDELSLDGEESDEASVHDETEDARRKRLVREIERDAAEATMNEVRKRERRGEELDEDEKQDIFDKFQDKFTEEMARYEAARKQREAIRKDVVNLIRVGAEKTGSAIKTWWDDVVANTTLIANKVTIASNNFWSERLSDVLNLEGFKETAPMIHAELEKSRTRLDDWSKQLEDSPVAKRALKGVESRLDVASGVRDRHKLTRQQTMQGQTFTVNQAEMENPIESARAQMDNLRELLAKGEITPDEMSDMLNSIAKSLDRRSSRTFSTQSDEFQGVAVLCPSCGAEGNTSNGPVCLKCSATLELDNDQLGQAFMVPHRELNHWAGQTGLTFNDGNFYVCLHDEMRSQYNPYDFSETKVFVFECAWEGEIDVESHSTPGKFRKRLRHTRWVVELTVPELNELQDALEAHSSKLFKGGAVPEMPNRIPKAGARSSRKKLTNMLRRSSRKASMAPPPQRLSAEEVIAKMQDWLEATVLGVAKLEEPGGRSSKRDHGNNPVFKVGFDKYFDVESSVKYLVEGA